MIIKIAKILGMYFVFEINFSKFIFEIKKLKTTNVNVNPKQYNNILKIASKPPLELTSKVISEIKYAL